VSRKKSDFPILPCRNCPHRRPDADGCCEECRDYCDFFWTKKWVRCVLRPRCEVCDRSEGCVHYDNSRPVTAGLGEGGEQP